MPAAFGPEHLVTRNGGQQNESLAADMDAAPIETFGYLDRTAFNGHHGFTKYQPLIAMCADTGDMAGTKLYHGSRNALQHAIAFMFTMN